MSILHGGGRGHWTVNYIGTQSIKNSFFFSVGSKSLGTLIAFWMVGSKLVVYELVNQYLKSKMGVILVIIIGKFYQFNVSCPIPLRSTQFYGNNG